jgi:uronate dehydrogenase
MKLDRAGKILVTGAAGRMGRAGVRALVAAGWRTRGFDLVTAPGTDDFVTGNLTDVAAIRRAMEGVSALIHLAATPDDDAFMERLLPNNIVGLYNVMEAARAAGVKRVLLASSGQVNWWQQFDGPLPIRSGDVLSPRHWYAVTKVAAEAAGMAFARTEGMSVLALRLGWLPRTGEQVAEITGHPHAQDVYLSPGDIGRFFVSAIQADIPQGFFPVYVTSRPKNRVIFDLDPVKRLVDWEPRDQWPSGSEEDLNRPVAGCPAS